MYFFFHLFAGIVLGLLAGDLLHDRRWVLPIIIGAVLPDLIDKPVGYFFFPDLFGSGRIFMHSIVIVGVLFVLGFLFWKCWAHPEVLAVAFGILSHQILDLIWEEPEAWFFPFFGVSHPSRGDDYAFALLLRDFSAASEWILALAMICAIILALAVRHHRSIITRYRNTWAWVLGAGTLVILILAGIILGTGISPAYYRLHRAFGLFGWNERMQFIIGGFVILMSAFLLWRIRSRIIDEKS